MPGNMATDIALVPEMEDIDENELARGPVAWSIVIGCPHVTSVLERGCWRLCDEKDMQSLGNHVELLWSWEAGAIVVFVLERL